MSTIMSIAPVTTSSYLSDLSPPIYMDEKNFLLGTEQHYPDTASGSSCVLSPRGLFRVFRYHSFEGEGGVPITITLNFSHRPKETTYLRIVIGRKPLNTAVRQIPKAGIWELEAIVPPMDNDTSLNPVVPITAQALTGSSGILDVVTVGSYTYWTRTRPIAPSLSRKSTDHDNTECLRQELSAAALSRSQSCPSSSYSDRSTSSPCTTPASIPRSRTSSTRSSGRSRSSKALNALRLGKKQALMRTRRFGPGEEFPESHRAVLELLTPLDSMCTNWDPEELKAGRRLVRFTRSQDGYRVKLSCESIKQDEYVEGDTVISCIYRRDADTCYVTSVDIIFLLESIVGEAFEIEEKNRIRRNLEGFRPKTISKNRAGSEGFFQQIMDFPAPKPRNIEKDVKVFEWSVLPQALEKIIAKYSLYYSLDPTDPSNASPDMSFRASPDMPTFSPSTNASEIPDRSDASDHFLYSSESFETNSSANAYASHNGPSQFIPFLTSSDNMSSYIDTPMTTPSSSSSDGGHIPYHAVYRIMPPSQSSFMTDISVPPGTVFTGDDYHSLERIRSPVSYF